MIRRINNKFKDLYVYLILFFKKRILFEDIYGLRYFLYMNTRPTDAFRRGVRTDDITVLSTVKQIVKSNSKHQEINCIDVGAFIGVVTLMMAKELSKTNSKWKVHSFEPFKPTFERLKDNLKINNSENIKINNLGLSNEAGVQKMLINNKAPGTNQLTSSNQSSEKDVSEVKVITLDEYLKQESVKNVLICKIDAEGVDDLVLLGMKSFLKNKSVDYLILEYEDDESKKRISEILEKYQYKVFYMVRNKNYLIENYDNYPRDVEPMINILAVSENASLEPLDTLVKQL